MLKLLCSVCGNLFSPPPATPPTGLVCPKCKAYGNALQFYVDTPDGGTVYVTPMGEAYLLKENVAIYHYTELEKRRVILPFLPKLPSNLLPKRIWVSDPNPRRVTDQYKLLYETNIGRGVTVPLDQLKIEETPSHLLIKQEKAWHKVDKFALELWTGEIYIAGDFPLEELV